MAARAHALCELDALEREQPPAIPSPAKVQATAAEIRRSWTPRQRRRRAQVARYMLLQQLLARVRTMPRADPEPGFRVTPKFPPSRC